LDDRSLALVVEKRCVPCWRGLRVLAADASKLELLLQDATARKVSEAIVSFLVTADALGRWAWHCHLMFHMDAGMFREVVVA